METDKNNDASANSLLPPGVKEYLSSYTNDEIARKMDIFTFFQVWYSKSMPLYFIQLQSMEREFEVSN